MLGFKNGQPQPKQQRQAIPGKMTSINQLDSQGSLLATDESCAIVHESSSPPNYYRARYGTPEGEVINMDRGGFGHHPDQCNYACVYDGVTSGGKINAYAAQAFTDFTCAFLEHRAQLLKTVDISSFAKQLFGGCVDSVNNPKGELNDYDAEGGSATGVYVTVSKKPKDSLEICGANIGDASAFLLDETQTHARTISTTSVRATGRPTDTGGQLTMSMGINGDIWPFKCPCHANDVIILCTDGLTDNLHMPELGTIVPFIARSTVFDGVPTIECRTCSGTHPHYPTLAELETILGPPQSQLASTAQIAVRLANYTHWVTAYSYNSEQEFYRTEMNIRQLHSEKLQLENVQSENPDLIMVLGQPKINEMIEELGSKIAHLSQLQKSRIKDRKTLTIGKTDDSIILCMKPKHALSLST